MRRTEWRPVLERACALAIEFYDGLPDRAVAPSAGAAAMLAAFDGPVPEAGRDPREVIDELAHLAEPGITGTPSGRFFGWVIGGGVRAAVAADWLTSAWDQNAAMGDGMPAAAAIEQVATRWVAELLELPAGSAALVTGAQMVSFVGLAVGRAEVLRAVGWDLDADGLTGAPAIRVIAGADRHGTIDRALRMLGFGTRQLAVVAADREGRMLPGALAEALAGDGPAIVCTQAGNVNGGGFDPMPEIVEHVAAARARRPIWVHVDGAFGLWARVAPARRALADGVEHADSWATDAHKWLNTPYDCGIALIRDAAAHRRVMRGGAAYLHGESAVRNPYDHTPELSRRARGFALWAALRELGRAGVADLVERCCAHAAGIAAGLAALPGAEVMNEVALNQLVVRFRDPAGRDDDGHTRAVLERVLAGGVCHPSGTTWRGVAGIRVSVSNWTTDADDVARTVDAFTRAHRG